MQEINLQQIIKSICNMSIIIVIGLLVNVFLYMIGKNDKWGE